MIDRFIAAMSAEEDGDLMLCREHGVAWQKDRQHQVPYDEAYFDRCAGYEGETISRAINAGRIALVGRHVGMNRVLDVGIGSGEFIKMRPATFGCDVNPVAVEWLKRNDLWAGRPQDFSGVTMWDVIEHLPDPDVYLRHIQLHAYLFVSLPIFERLDDIRQSRHYRPGEHLTYWTESGFVGWMDRHGFRMLERSDHEIQAGRDSILSFALKRYRWPQEERAAA